MPWQPAPFVFRLLSDSYFEILVLRFIQIYLLCFVWDVWMLCKWLCKGVFPWKGFFLRASASFYSQRGSAALQISDASVSEENQRHSQQNRTSQKSMLFIYLAVKLQRETRETASGFTVYIYVLLQNLVCNYSFDFTCFDNMHHNKSPRELLRDTAVIFLNKSSDFHTESVKHSETRPKSTSTKNQRREMIWRH